jgi:hypothetical protein
MPRGRIPLMAAALVLAAATGFGQATKSRSAGKTPEAALSAAAPAMSGRGEARTAPAAKPAPGDAGVTVIERDGGPKQFRFTETDIEGRLKAPQLVYFLRRVRAEFAAGDLGHRSFLRELSETRHDPDF